MKPVYRNCSMALKECELSVNCMCDTSPRGEPFSMSA